jgi:hypothetical protein
VDKETKSGLSLTTLAISAAAAVAAAVIVPMFWERGTLIATAMTPVIVALVSEGLRKPVEKVSAVAPRPVRRTPGSATAPVTEPFEPLPASERTAASRTRGDDPFGLREPSRRGPTARHWKIALGTGVAAFAIAVIAVTGSELLFGGPATADGGRTTFFSSRDRSEATPTPTPTATPGATETPAPTATGEATPTPTPVPTTTPAPTTEAAPAPGAPTPTVTPTPAP